MGLQIREMIGDFHENGDARAGIVGTDKRQIMALLQDFLVGVWPCIVVGADHNPLANLGFPRPDQVHHDESFAGQGVHRPKRLPSNLGPHFGEVLSDQFADARIGL